MSWQRLFVKYLDIIWREVTVTLIKKRQEKKKKKKKDFKLQNLNLKKKKKERKFNCAENLFKSYNC